MTTPLPDIDWQTDGERAQLEAFLAYFRAVLARKAEGLDDAQVRTAACPPSELHLLGLIRHMADVERFWAQGAFRADPEWVPLYYGPGHPDGDPDGDLHPRPDETIDEAFEAYWRELAAADAVYAAADLDDVQRGQDKRRNLRWIYIHLIEEYARHCGHADLLREAIDGATGD